MRVLLDTNVILDVLLQREPWRQASDAVWDAVDNEALTGFLSASTLTDIFYVAARARGPEFGVAAVQLCMATFEIASVGRQLLEHALAMEGHDFEDNVQVAVATLLSVDAIVTRDSVGFAHARIPVLTPSSLLEQLRG
jgi:predicted nucleic acid-binding protein